MPMPAEAAVCIQCFWRCFAARREVGGLRRRREARLQQEHDDLVHGSAAAIQGMWRAKRLKCTLRAMRDADDLQALLDRHNDAACSVQAGWRHHASRRERRYSLTAHASSIVREESAALIQSFWRGCAVRRQMAREMQAILPRPCRAAAALIIEAWYRVRRLARERQMRYADEVRSNASTLVQKHYRRHAQMRETHKLLCAARAARQDIVRFEAAECLQRMARCHAARAEATRRRARAATIRRSATLTLPALQRIGRALAARRVLGVARAARRSQAATTLATHLCPLAAGRRLIPDAQDTMHLLLACRQLEQRYVREDDAALVISTCARGHLARRELRRRRVRAAVLLRQEGSARILQRACRRFLSCARAARLRARRDSREALLQEQEAAVFRAFLPALSPVALQIQRAFRGHRGRARAQLLRRRAGDAAAWQRGVLRDEAASAIQATFRGHRVRTAFRERAAHAGLASMLQGMLRAKHSTRIAQHRAARLALASRAVILQRAFRCHYARLSAGWRRMEAAEALEAQRCRIAATLIQRNYRARLATRRVCLLRDNKALRLASAVRMQAVARRFLARKNHYIPLTALRAAQWEEMRILSAGLEVTRVARGAVARIRTRALRNRKSSACLAIQRVYRGWAGRRSAVRRRDAALLRQTHARQGLAALEIQAFWRMVEAKKLRARLSYERRQAHIAKLTRERMALCLQCLGRALPARQWLGLDHRVKADAAVQIQRVVKGRQARLHIVPLRRERLHATMCHRIQRVWRRERVRLRSLLEIREMEMRIGRINMHELLRAEGQARVDIASEGHRGGAAVAEEFHSRIQAYLKRMSAPRTETHHRLYCEHLEATGTPAQLSTFAMKIQMSWRRLQARRIVGTIRGTRRARGGGGVGGVSAAEEAVAEDEHAFHALSTSMVDRSAKGQDLLYFVYDPDSKEERVKEKLARRRAQLQQAQGGRAHGDEESVQQGHANVNVNPAKRGLGYSDAHEGGGGGAAQQHQVSEIDWRASVAAQRQQNPALVSLLYEEEARRGEVLLYHRCVMDDVRKAFVDGALRTRRVDPPHAATPRGGARCDIRFDAALAGDVPKRACHKAPRPDELHPVFARNVPDSVIASCLGGNVIDAGDPQARSFANYGKSASCAPPQAQRNRTLLPLKFAPDLARGCCGDPAALHDSNVIDPGAEVGLVAKVESREQLQSLVRQVSMDDPMVRRCVLKGLGLSDTDVKPLLQTLRYNTHVRAIDMSHNALSDATAEELSAVLVANNSLASIDLSHTYITETGVTHLAQAVYTNPVLSSIDLGNTLVPRHVLTALNERLKAKAASLLPGGRARPRREGTARPLPHDAGKHVPFYKRKGVPAATIGACGVPDSDF